MTERDDGPVSNFTRPVTADALPPLADDWDRADLQRIWLGTQSRAWRMLAVVPADEGISTYEVASLITTLGRHHGESVGLADLRDIRLNRVDAFLDAAKELVGRGQRVVFATRSITGNLATIPLARASEGVILCVSMGSTLLGSIEEMVEQIGKERILGSMLIHEAGGGAPVRRSAPKLLQARA